MCYYVFTMTETLHVIAGCMFAGKSAELVRQEERARIAKIKIQVFKPDIDNRWNATDQVVAHNGKRCTATPIPTAHPTVLLEKVSKDTKLVAIDEVQFFAPQIISVVKELLTNNIRVIVAGLPLDFRGEPFGSMPLLLAMADYITRLSAICTFEENGETCKNEATKTQRFINGELANYHDPIVLIGGQESYAARCSKHHVVPGKPN